MSRPYRRNVLRIAALMTLILASFEAFHQLSYIVDVVAPGPSKQPIRTIATCRLSNHENAGPTSPQASPNIPNLVHQIWKTSDVSTYPLKASHNSWKFFFEPLGYSIKLWTDKDIRILIQEKYPWLLHTYDGYSSNIQRADIARLVVVHAYGGIYADLDVYPVSKNLAIRNGINCIQNLGVQAVFPPMTGNNGLSNHFLVAQKGSMFLEAALREAIRRSGSRSNRVISQYIRVFWSTGPLMITAAARQFIELSSTSTSSHSLAMMDRDFIRSVISHKAGRSWHSWDGHILNWIADHVGKVHCMMILGLLIGTSIGSWFILRRRRNELS